jgi:hypothetical protein
MQACNDPFCGQQDTRGERQYCDRCKLARQRLAEYAVTIDGIELADQGKLEFAFDLGGEG